MIWRKTKKKKFRYDSDYNKVGRDFFEVVSIYHKYTTNTEYIIFLGVPIIVSVLVFISVFFLKFSNSDLLNGIVEMNNTSLSVLAILAGFNTTSLSIIAATSNKEIFHLNSKDSSHNKESVLKQLVAFFTFAIIIQLLVLIIGFVITVISKSFIEINTSIIYIPNVAIRAILSVFGIVWLSIILFSLVISLRNTTLLYRYVLFISNFRD